MAADEDVTAGGPQEPPFLRVITPDVTPEEVAALVAVLAGLGGGGEQPPPRRHPEWAHPRRGMRVSLRHGAGAWRSSALPR